MKEYKNITLDHETNPWATHQPALIWAIEKSEGDVLELGVGNSSTVLLNSLLKNTGRNLVSAEDTDSWLDQFIYMESNFHKFKIVDRSIEKWKEFIDDCSKKKWGVVFVDQAYGEIWYPVRHYAVEVLCNVSDYVVVHDADLCLEIKKEEYNYFEYIPTICPIPDRKGPSTYIISKKHDVKNIQILE